MILQRLSLFHFRNVKEAELTFSDGVNFLVGKNAQGKTNALEAIYFFARGKSFRDASDAEMVRFGESGFRIGISFSDEKREQSLSYSFENGKRKRTKNGFPVEKNAEMVGVFRAVLFCPDHLQMIKGSPELRRNFMNVGISQFCHEYLIRYVQYKRILDNRNALLKSAQKGFFFDRSELSAWSEQMAREAAYLHLKRINYMKLLEEEASQMMGRISGGAETLSLSYESDASGEDEKALEKSYLSLLSASLDRECAAGCSLFGVHRDDLKITVSGISAKEYASQGQQRSAVLSLKLAEGEVCRRACGEYPVFLFDDVLSELDETRRAFVFEGAEKRQFIVTSCENADYGNTHTLKVEKGSYVPFTR